MVLKDGEEDYVFVQMQHNKVMEMTKFNSSFRIRFWVLTYVSWNLIIVELNVEVRYDRSRKVSEDWMIF